MGGRRWDELAGRVAVLEAAMAAAREAARAVTREEVRRERGGEPEPEVRTRRLVVVDDLGRPRIVARVVRGMAEVVVEGAETGPGERTGVALFATGGPGPKGGAGGELGEGLGVQVWVHGDPVVEMEAWQEDGGRWTPRVRLSG